MPTKPIPTVPVKSCLPSSIRELAVETIRLERAENLAMIDALKAGDPELTGLIRKGLLEEDKLSDYSDKLDAAIIFLERLPACDDDDSIIAHSPGKARSRADRSMGFLNGGRLTRRNPSVQ